MPVRAGPTGLVLSVAIAIAASAYAVTSEGDVNSSSSSQSRPSASSRLADQALRAAGNSVLMPPPECFRGTDAIQHRIAALGGTRMVTLGAGPRGIVFAPISWGDACEWADEAQRLAAGGYQVVTFDWGGDREATVNAATRLLRERGAEHIAWVGGCLGGTVMLGMADRAEHPPVGIAGVSPLSTLAGSQVRTGQRYRGKVLVLGTTDDPLADERRLRQVAAAMPTAELTLLPGDLHAADIFKGPCGERARRGIDAFLTLAFEGVR